MARSCNREERVPGRWNAELLLPSRQDPRAGRLTLKTAGDEPKSLASVTSVVSKKLNCLHYKLISDEADIMKRLELPLQPGHPNWYSLTLQPYRSIAWAQLRHARVSSFRSAGYRTGRQRSTRAPRALPTCLLRQCCFGAE